MPPASLGPAYMGLLPWELLPALDPLYSHGGDFCRSRGQLQALAMLITDGQGNSRDRRQLPRKCRQCANSLTPSDTVGYFWHWQVCQWCGMGLVDWIAWPFDSSQRQPSKQKEEGENNPHSPYTDINCVCLTHYYPLYMIFLFIIDPWGRYCYIHYICQELQST